MKTITFVYPQMVMGGAEKVLIRLIEQIDRKNYTVNAFLMKRGGELEHSIPDDVKVTYASTVSPFKALNQGGYGAPLKSCIIAFGSEVLNRMKRNHIIHI